MVLIILASAQNTRTSHHDADSALNEINSNEFNSVYSSGSSNNNPVVKSFDFVHYVDCENPLAGHYFCERVKIDSKTQQPMGCSQANFAPLLCHLNAGLHCASGTSNDASNTSFTRHIPCQWTNGYSYETTLLLSIFLGMFGADRFYLGYPGLGLLKFCTLGFLFFGQLIDVVLIAMQIVRPADGSNYVIKHFGPKLTILAMDNQSYIVPRSDW